MSFINLSKAVCWPNARSQKLSWSVNALCDLIIKKSGKQQKNQLVIKGLLSYPPLNHTFAYSTHACKHCLTRAKSLILTICLFMTSILILPLPYRLQQTTLVFYSV